MPRGVTETTRGEAYYPKEQSTIGKRNATEQDLAVAQKHYVGKHIKLTPKNDQQNPPPYRCVGVRLDSLRRLIFDLVREDLAEAEREASHA